MYQLILKKGWFKVATLTGIGNSIVNRGAQAAYPLSPLIIKSGPGEESREEREGSPPAFTTLGETYIC